MARFWAGVALGLGLTLMAGWVWADELAVAEGTSAKAGRQSSYPEHDSSGKTCSCQSVQAAVSGAHRVLFYDNDFDYLCDPCYAGRHLGDNLKRLCLGSHLTIDVGGQYRTRLHNERNLRGAGLTGRDDDFLLHRTRLYLNAQLGDRLRFYGEMIDAVSTDERFTPRPIEENRIDAQNLFLDVDVWQHAAGDTWTARIGRQELRYGSQRLISPLDWGNTRRTFEGGKMMWENCAWDVDAFWVRPMKRDPGEFDAPNLDREMYGLYGHFKEFTEDNLDAYWLALDHHDQDFRFDTIGARYWGDLNNWLFEVEGGYQFGEDPDGTDHHAGFFTAGLGRSFVCAPGTPSVWLYYDWASGDDNGNGFHHYNPLAHKYLGFMDLFGRRNIEDINVMATAQVSERLQLLVWWHYFFLENGRDVPYTVTMQPFANLPPGSSGSQELGHEIDVVATFSIRPRASLSFGYSHFFAGDYYATTPGVPFDGDADFFYTEFTVDF